VSDSLKDVSAISLFVEDLPKAKGFYQEVFEVPVVFEDETSVCFKFDRLFINLLQSSVAAEQVEPGQVAAPESGHRFQLAIWVDDVDAVCAKLEQRGVKLVNGPADRSWGMRSAAFVDPAGHSWEVAQELNQSES
jgi:catechol 2,3-dioxygenase-like lactoylglutathione lyase family enzyme